MFEEGDTSCEKYVACGGVPRDDADPLGVSFQDHDGIGEGADQRVIWNLPHLERRDEGLSAVCGMITRQGRILRNTVAGTASASQGTQTLASSCTTFQIQRLKVKP